MSFIADGAAAVPVEAAFPVESLRSEFPALRAGDFLFFDNAAGSQVPQEVAAAVHEHLVERNVQRGGRYGRSMEVDAMLAHARAGVCAWLNARAPEEIAFGMNATSFIRLVSLAIGQTLRDRNEIIVTELDHESNVATWLALAPMGAKIRWWRLRADGNLHLEDLEPLLSERTRLLACTAASNALGTLVDVRGAADVVHASGAQIFLDCVHFAPHGAIDVQSLDCDYLVCSGYKAFGPHMGFLWGRRALLERLPTFREDFIADEPPGKIEAGTIPYESVAGMDAAVRYLARVGMPAIAAYEQMLSLELLRVLADCRATVYGVTEPSRVSERVPTFAFNVPGLAPAAVTTAMARAGIGVRDGHLYCPRLMRRLSLREESGAVRVSLVHYNTVAEIHRFGNVLSDLTRGGPHP